MPEIDMNLDLFSLRKELDGVVTDPETKSSINQVSFELPKKSMFSEMLMLYFLMETINKS